MKVYEKPMIEEYELKLEEMLACSSTKPKRNCHALRGRKSCHPGKLWSHDSSTCP